MTEWTMWLVFVFEFLQTALQVLRQLLIVK